MAPRSNTMTTAKNGKLRGYDIEKKKIKEILVTALTTENMFDKLLSKFSLLNTLRVLS